MAFLSFLKIFFALVVGFPLYYEIFYFITMILQRIKIIMGDAGFDPGTSAPEVWCATAEPSHFFLIETQLAVILNFKMIIRLCGVNDVMMLYIYRYIDIYIMMLMSSGCF